MSEGANVLDALLSLMWIQGTLAVINFKRNRRFPLPTGRLLSASSVFGLSSPSVGRLAVNGTETRAAVSQEIVLIGRNMLKRV
jgi:hypothetical protein